MNVNSEDEPPDLEPKIPVIQFIKGVEDELAQILRGKQSSSVTSLYSLGKGSKGIRRDNSGDKFSPLIEYGFNFTDSGGINYVCCARSQFNLSEETDPNKVLEVNPDPVRYGYFTKSHCFGVPRLTLRTKDLVQISEVDIYGEESPIYWEGLIGMDFLQGIRTIHHRNILESLWDDPFGGSASLLAKEPDFFDMY
jgi:hypothetical protein